MNTKRTPGVLVLEALNSSAFTAIVCDRPNADRIIRRAITHNWFFVHRFWNGRTILIFSQAIDLDRDIRDKIKGVQFALYSEVM